MPLRATWISETVMINEVTKVTLDADSAHEAGHELAPVLNLECDVDSILDAGHEAEVYDVDADAGNEAGPSMMLHHHLQARGCTHCHCARQLCSHANSNTIVVTAIVSWLLLTIGATTIQNQVRSLRASSQLEQNDLRLGSRCRQNR